MKNGKTLRQMGADFISNQDTKPETRKFDTYILDLFFRFLVEQRINVEDIRRPHIIAYKQKLISEGKSPLTIDKYVGLVRRFFQYLDAQGLHDDVTKGVHNVKRHKGYRKKFLNKDQVVELLNSIDTTTVIGLRDFAMINLMVRTGLRRCEVQRLKVSDVSYNTLRITRKGRIESELLGIGDSVIDPIHDYLVRCRLSDDSYLFTSLSQRSMGGRLNLTNISSIVKDRIKVVLDDDKISCHSLRHSFAVNAILGGATIFEVQNALGHDSAETTKIYLSMIESMTKLSNPAHRAVSVLFDNELKTPLKHRLNQ